MIDLISLKRYFDSSFEITKIRYYNFGTNFQVEIDYSNASLYKLSLECSSEDVKIGKVSKESLIDFSYYDVIFYNNSDVENYISQIYC